MESRELQPTTAQTALFPQIDMLWGVLHLQAEALHVCIDLTLQVLLFLNPEL